MATTTIDSAKPEAGPTVKSVAAAIARATVNSDLPAGTVLPIPDQAITPTPLRAEASLTSAATALPEGADFQAVLAQLKANSTSTKEQGLNFEQLVGQILSSAQPWCERYAKVESYAQWAQSHPNLTDTTRDLGIDLVATNKVAPTYGSGSEPADLSALCPDAPWGYTAIQCKFFGRHNTIPKGELDSFIAESNRPYFTGRCLVHTGTLGSNAMLALKHCVPEVQVISSHELAQANINWDHLLERHQVELTYRQLRPYQREALTSVINGFKEHDRGQLIMACGTGKTFTALKIAETQLKPQGMVLYLAPSLSLVSQLCRMLRY